MILVNVCLLKTYRIYVFILILILCPVSNAIAEKVSDPPLENSMEIDKADGFFTTVVSKLDNTHNSISSGLERTVGSIDAFFADDKVFEQANQSYLRIALDIVSHEYEGTGFAGDLKLKADMPLTKRRLKLLIETDSQRDSKENLDDLPTDVVQKRDYFVSLERKLESADKWDVRPALGIKMRTPIDTFGRIRSYRYFPVNSWLLRVSNNLDWFDSRGFGANGALEFDRAITEKLLFRATSSLSWREEENFRRFEQSFALFQRLNDKENIAYQIAGYADDEFDWRANQYIARVRYRKQLYKKWMFGEIIPQSNFRKLTGFHNELSLTFRLEMVFGNKYL